MFVTNSDQCGGFVLDYLEEAPHNRGVPFRQSAPMSALQSEAVGRVAIDWNELCGPALRSTEFTCIGPLARVLM